MVLTVFLALALQNAPAPPNADIQREILVIGNKLKPWSARFRTRKGEFLCAIRKSTGDKEIDAIGCDSMATCLPQLRSRLAAGANKKVKGAERKAMTAAINRDFGTCVMSQRDARIADLAERRFQARQGTN